ncbi:MAG TPA: vWA domain-containing protein, partial [Ignavibacteriaceae bacterium]|nr:vWA domain-containing protein [Ignavibacteriaceae bacterium]
MPGLEKINLTFSFNPLYFFLFLILAGAYSIYIYKFTVPPVSRSKKIVLICLRILALLLLLFIVFEPILTLTKKITFEPLNLVFVDNSRSIQIKDGTNREENIKEFLRILNERGLKKNLSFYTFGTRVKKADFLEGDDNSLNSLNFSEGSSNFSNIFSGYESNSEDLEEKGRSISSIVIISDGVITEGSSPIYRAEKLNIPVFTVGVGDSTRRNDVEIKNIINNEFIYSETPKIINASVRNTGFIGQKILLSLYENETLLEQKEITLNQDGVQSINLNYTPKTSGEKKITLRAAEIKGEFT